MTPFDAFLTYPSFSMMKNCGHIRPPLSTPFFLSMATRGSVLRSRAGALQDFRFFPVLHCLNLYRPPELNHLPNGAGKARLCRAEHVLLVVETADKCS